MDVIIRILLRVLLPLTLSCRVVSLAIELSKVSFCGVMSHTDRVSALSGHNQVMFHLSDTQIELVRKCQTLLARLSWLGESLHAVLKHSSQKLEQFRNPTMTASAKSVPEMMCVWLQWCNLHESGVELLLISHLILFYI